MSLSARSQVDVSQCLFHHEAIGVPVMVHGDDVIAVGPEEQLKDTQKILEH